ncbi:hypothetical protein D3C71_1006350 [compost metagenome]
MEAGVAEQFVEDADALHEQADVKLVGHADAAVHLHRLLHREFGDTAGLGLGDARSLLGVGTARVDGLKRGQGRGLGQLQLGEQVGGAVLQGLKLADQLAELLAGAQVFKRHLEGLVARPDQRRCGAGPAQHERGVQRPLPLARGADHGVGVHHHIGQGHAGGVVSVDHDGALDRDAGGLRVDQEEGQTFIRLRRDDQGVGDVAIQHEALGAVQLEAVAGAFGACRDPGGRVLGTFIHGEAEDGLARRDLGQPGLLRV